jgi:hypothetical protein
MDAYRTRQLCQTADGQFDFFARRHDQIGKLINYKNYKW